MELITRAKTQVVLMLIMLVFAGCIRPPGIPPPAALTVTAPRGSELREELDRRMAVDQDARRASMEAPTDEATFAKLVEVDAENTAWLKQIVEQYGWPGQSLVGKDGAMAAWLLVQHADQDVAFQKHCLALMEAALPQGEVEAQHVAYLYDRVAAHEGRPQRYGTQGQCTEPGAWQPSALEDPDHVDEFRAGVGLSPLAEYVQTIAVQCQ